MKTKTNRILFPVVLIINYTYACNSKCIMCNIWRNKLLKEISLLDWEKALSSPLFQKVEYAHLSGGEPSLKTNLSDFVEILTFNLPSLKKLSISTNGLLPERANKLFSKIATTCLKKKISFSLNVSIDGIGKSNDDIRGIDGAFDRSLQTLTNLILLRKKINFNLAISTTIIAKNVQKLNTINNLARKLDTKANFSIGVVSDKYYRNKENAAKIRFSESEKELLIEFLKNQFMKCRWDNANGYYYLQSYKRIKNGVNSKRNFPCPFNQYGLVIDSYGDIRYCLNSDIIGNFMLRTPENIYFDPKNIECRNIVKEKICPSCFFDCMHYVSLKKNKHTYLIYLIERIIRKNYRGKPFRRNR